MLVINPMNLWSGNSVFIIKMPEMRVTLYNELYREELNPTIVISVMETSVLYSLKLAVWLAALA